MLLEGLLASWGVIGASWAVLGPSWGPRRAAILGRLGAVLGHLEAVLGRLGPILGPSWGSWVLLGQSCGPVGLLSLMSWAIFGPS